MAVKIRLARKGRKKLAFYHIVVADSRSPRDGRYIEKIGSYNPVTNPATIELDFDKALGWLQNGALPTDTCRAILSYKGVLIKKHLLEGVKKGAFDEAEATKRFEEWIKQNEEKIESKKSGLEKSQDEELGKRLTEEKRISDARSAKIQKRNADLAAKAAAVNEPVAETEEPVAEAEEAVIADQPEAVTEEPVAEAEEAVIADQPEAVTEEPVAEAEEAVIAEEPEVAAEEPVQKQVDEENASDAVADEKPKE